MASEQCNIDVSRYVAFGDSITSGYMDGALYYAAQLDAYPSILSKQFCQNAEDFKQPLMNFDSVGVNPDGEARLVLKKGENPNDFILTRLEPKGDVNAFAENNYLNLGPYHNIGVPGAKVITSTMPGFGNPANGFGNYNPFFTRMASNPVKSSMLSDTLLIDPTFFSIFIGNNDALAFALSGGTLNTISSLENFENIYRTIINALTKNNSKGVFANLPSILNLPFFTTIPFNGLILNDAEAELLNKEYDKAGIKFHPGQNNFPIVDVTKEQGIRQIEEGEFILLDLILDKKKDGYLKGKKPIPKKYTLSRTLVSEVENATNGYNKIIKTIATEKRLAFVDVHEILKTAKPDRMYNPETHNIDYARKGVFSLDGLHPNTFGQALLANEFIKVINSFFGCDFKPVKSHRYKGITFP